LWIDPAYASGEWPAGLDGCTSKDCPQCSDPDVVVRIDEAGARPLRQGDAQVFKRYSQAKLKMMREALTKLDRQANERPGTFSTARPN